MKYTLNTTNYCTYETFEVNKLPARTYFIPYTDRAGADAVSLKEKRYRSEKVLCLNGKWDFKFYPRPAELPIALDTNQIAFDTMDVPACWQFRGYDKPFYVNIRYQFPYKPPVIPTLEPAGKVFSWTGVDQGISLRRVQPDEQYNFVGVYRRFLTIDDPGKHYVIDFMGVASCMDLYVNGDFVGYSEGAHNIAGFDLSGRLKQGENELVVVVHRWCNGTYLEGQDMFRNNGIFRDVLLRVSEHTDLWDIDAKTKKIGGTYALTLRGEALSDTRVTFTLEGHGLTRTAAVDTQDKTAEVTFSDLPVTEWNAEEPTLYSIYYETPTCCVKERLGFRTVTIQGDVLRINGSRVKFKGVNHHDTSPTNGYTMTADEIERDVLLCKRFNIDTIRTSHYPPDPLLLELADELGLYIVDENDLETHGTFAHQLPPTYNSISHDPKWQRHYLDRISRLYQRDKIHGNTSIFMWSLGNEAGGYQDQREELLSCEPMDGGFRVVTRVSNRKNRFTVTDTYEQTTQGILVTSRLHCRSGRGIVPRFGKSFRLDAVFDSVNYTGRCGESYADMKDQFPVRAVHCQVSDMTEPNIRPQESGNRCDCTVASVSDGKTRVIFQAVDKPFELGIKPYTDKALCGMRHRKDEVRTGTYVTIQAFQQGIGTGACGPGIMPQFQYSANEDYTLRFLIRLESEQGRN